MYKILKNGQLLSIVNTLKYVQKQSNDCFNLCSQEHAHGIAVDSNVYHLEGLTYLDGLETVTIENIGNNILINDYKVAAEAFSKQANAGEISEIIISEHPNILPQLKLNNELVKSGTYINWKGAIKRAAVDLWDTNENNPDNAPYLWNDISYKEGYRIIPTTISVALAFAKDELGWWEDTLYRSLLDANVWTPEANPQGWEEIVE